MANLSDLFPAPAGGTTNVPSTVTYTPAMLKYDGSSYYARTSTQTFSSQTETTVFRVKMPSFTGNSSQRVWNVRSTSDIRTTIRAYSSDYSADTALQNRFTFEVRSSGNTVICKICTNIDIADGEQKNILFAFNGTSGAATLTINGIDADDTGWANRVAPTTGTPASASMQVGLGDDPVGSGNEYVGEMGFFGWSLSYLTNYLDFFDSNGNPIKQDTTTWANSGWGSQPLFWNEHGDMANNKGSAGAMTENGTIVVADEPLSSNGWVLPIGDQSTDLTTGTGKFTFRMPTAFTLEEVRASVTTAPTGAAIQVDINEGGTSVLSTVISIDAGEKSSTTAATPPVISDSALADDAEITIDIDQVGSTVAGTGLKVYLLGRAG